MLIAIDARAGGERAARLHRAFTDWIGALGRGRDGAETLTVRRILPSEELFGPGAHGGCLVRVPHGDEGWRLLTPDAGVAGGGAVPVHGPSSAGAPSVL